MTTDPAFAASVCRDKLKPGFVPRIGLVLGSGLGPLAECIEDATVIPYSDIEGFPQSSVKGHNGKLHLGLLNGLPVACLQGRIHLYEGVPYANIKTLIRSLKNLGCEQLLLTNAAGSLREEIGVGEVVAISDHINMQFHNPLVGPNDESYGERFVGMENAYNSDLRRQLREAARLQDINLHEGVYLGVLGPSFETPAEIRAYRILGADLVGMSTIAEVIIARHCGLKVAALSAVTNLAAGMHSEPLTHEVTLSGAKRAAKNMVKIISTFAAAQAEAIP